MDSTYKQQLYTLSEACYANSEAKIRLATMMFMPGWCRDLCNQRLYMPHPHGIQNNHQNWPPNVSPFAHLQNSWQLIISWHTFACWAGRLHARDGLQCFGNIVPRKAIRVQLLQQLLAITGAESQSCAHCDPALHTSNLQVQMIIQAMLSIRVTSYADFEMQMVKNTVNDWPKQQSMQYHAP